MAIPKAFESEQLRAVSDFYETLDSSELLPLHHDDTFLIGAFVQVFSRIELNLRRSIEIFRAEELITKKEPHISELVKLIKGAVAALNPQDPDLDDILGKLDEIEFRRPFRNLLAHWAGRRIPGHDAIVLLSMDTRDAETVLGVNALTKDHCLYSVVMLPDLRGLLLHISKYDEWLAKKTSAWHIQLSSPVVR